MLNAEEKTALVFFIAGVVVISTADLSLITAWVSGVLIGAAMATSPNEPEPELLGPPEGAA